MGTGRLVAPLVRAWSKEVRGIASGWSSEASLSPCWGQCALTISLPSLKVSFSQAAVLIRVATGDTFGAFLDFLCWFLRSEGSDGFTRLPHFGIAHSLQFFLELLLVVFPSASADHAFGFGTAFDSFIEFAEDR